MSPLSTESPPSTARKSRLQAILLAAREVFAEQGYEAAKVSDIARRVGVVEGTVFHYVGNKRGLVLMVIEQFYEELIQAQEQGLAGVVGTRDRLLFLIRFHLTMLSDYPALCGVILNEGRNANHSLTQDIRRLNRRYTRPLVDELEAGVSRGEIRATVSPPLVRNIIYGTMEQALWARLADGQPIPVEDIISELNAVVLDGIRRRQSAELPNQAEVEVLVRRLNTLLSE